MGNLCVSIVWGEIDSISGEREYNCQYHDNIIPSVGAKFSFWTTRDQDGSYRKHEEIKEVVSGVVESLEYLHQTSGKDSFSNRQTMYVVVTLADAKMGDAWSV